MLNIHHKSTFTFFLLILTLREVWSSRSSKRLTKPKNLSIASHNLNAVLTWNASVLVTSKNRSADHVITYTVRHKVWVSNVERWIVLSYCNRTTKLSCKLRDVNADDHMYDVIAYYGDNIKARSDFIRIEPHFYEKLHPPKFSLSFVNSNLTINISNPSRVDWSGELLYDYLKNYSIHGPYFLLYYVSYTINNKTSYSKKFDAGSDVLSFPVNKKPGDEICIKLQLRGEISFEESYWSEPICIREPLETWTTQGGIIAGSILGFVLLLLLIGTALILTKRIKKFLKPALGPIPYELRVLADEMQNNGKFKPSLDVAGEHVTLYCPKQDKKLAKKGSYRSLGSSLKDIPTHVRPVTKNDYVVSRLGQSRSPPIEILTLHGNKGEGNDNYVSDYVCVPSPDSGIGMTVGF